MKLLFDFGNLYAFTCVVLPCLMLLDLLKVAQNELWRLVFGGCFGPNYVVMQKNTLVLTLVAFPFRTRLAQDLQYIVYDI